MNATQQALIADFVFDGVAVRRGAAVVMEGAKITGVLPASELPRSIPTRSLPDGAWLAPGFIDVQVNGGGNVLFNDQPTVDGIRAIAAAHRRFGTTSLLPTLISDAPEKTNSALSAVSELVGRDPSILGIHLEGPFLSPEKPGVHSLQYIRDPTPEDEQALMRPNAGVKVLTLAPERVPKGFIGRLTNAGFRISLGHSVATYEQAKAAMSEGLTGFTHLFNAMRPLASREPGPIAAAIESPSVWFGMVVDGEHVDPAMLRLALRGEAAPMLVTDAMPPVGGTHAGFRLYGEPIKCEHGRCVRGDGALAGSSLDMASAVRNCVRILGVPLERALRFASVNPASFLGVDQSLGRLAPGYRADIVAIDPERIDVEAVWVAGVDQHAVNNAM
jgi:N-acetylglucosamine-6-phosphate deacetylase